MSIEGNKTIARRVCEEAWNQGKLEVLDECYTDPFIFHYRGTKSWTLERYKQIIRYWRSTFANFQFEIGDVFAEGNKVALRIPFRGKHVDTFAGIAPTGIVIHCTEMVIARFVDGKIVEEWEEFDELGLLKQLGATTIS